MANTIARLASVFQKARDLLSAQYIRSVFGRVFAVLRKWRFLLAHFSGSRDSAIVACARSLFRAFFYNRIWDKLVTACEGAKIVGWGIVFATVAFLLVMVTITPILGGMLAIAT